MTATIHHLPLYTEEIAVARRVLCDPDAHPIDAVDNACITLEYWSKDPADKARAKEVRRSVGVRAAAQVNAEIRELYGKPAPRSLFTIDDALVFCAGFFLAGCLAAAAFTWATGG